MEPQGDSCGRRFLAKNRQWWSTSRITLRPSTVLLVSTGPSSLTHRLANPLMFPTLNVAVSEILLKKKKLAMAATQIQKLNTIVMTMGKNNRPF